MIRAFGILLCFGVLLCGKVHAGDTPEGYVIQKLEETDGSILRPKDWNFESSGTPSGWTWCISKDKPINGAYETGVRIQLLIGVAEGTGKSREQFVSEALGAKASVAHEVIRNCEPVDMGTFVRQCLEVVEETSFRGENVKFRVLYSAMWFKEMDMVALSIFGSPREEWASVSEVSDRMAQFTLIGPRFGK